MDKDKQIQNFVITSNDLIEAKYDYSLWEKRIFVYMISTLRRDDTGFKPVRIYIRDLMRFFGTNSNNDYSIIRAIPETISRKPFYVPYQTPEGGKRWNIISVLSTGTQPIVGDRSEGNAYIELKFNSDLIPYLLELKEKFTKYDIRNITGLKSVYSIRLYEYLKENEWRKQVFEISIEELKDMFCMSAKDNDGKELYPLYADFKKRVLFKAQEDLSNYCDIQFEFWERKQGKKVVAVVFQIAKNEHSHKADDRVEEEQNDTQNDLKKAKQMLYNELFPQAKLMDINEAVLQHIIDTYDADTVRQGFDYTVTEFKKGKIIDNIDGYFIAAVKNGYTNPTFQRSQKSKKITNDRKQRATIKQQKESVLANIKDEYEQARKGLIRLLTEQNPNVTIEAIEALQPSLQTYFQLKGITSEDLSVEDYRQEPMLRALVIEKIQTLYPDFFIELSPIQREIKSLEVEISML